MEALNILMRIEMNAKSIGNFIGGRLELETDKVVGNNFCCMGFKQLKNGEYIPNTAWNGDVKTMLQKPQDKVLVTLKKLKTDEYYTKVSYQAKGITAKNLSLPSNVKLL